MRIHYITAVRTYIYVSLTIRRISAVGYLTDDKSEERKRAYSPTYTHIEQLGFKVC